MADDMDVKGMDPALVAQAQQGDQQAFQTLALAAHPRLLRVARGVLQDDQTAEDATRQALIAIWRYLPRLRDPLKFDGWSYRLLVRACYAEAKHDPKWLPESAMTGDRESVASDDFLCVVQRDHSSPPSGSHLGHLYRGRPHSHDQSPVAARACVRVWEFP